jgi:hypothetical protein
MNRQILLWMHKCITDFLAPLRQARREGRTSGGVKEGRTFIGPERMIYKGLWAEVLRFSPFLLTSAHFYLVAQACQWDDALEPIDN